MNQNEIEYLAFEGGGGKGAAYVGAVAALEKLKILPIDIDKNIVRTDVIPYELSSQVRLTDGWNSSKDPTKQNQIKGIAGSSAGAITAFMLAMGGSSKDIVDQMKDPKQFLDFFDVPKSKHTLTFFGKRMTECRHSIKSVELNRYDSNVIPSGGEIGIQPLGSTTRGILKNVLKAVRNYFLGKPTDKYKRSKDSPIVEKIMFNKEWHDCYKLPYIKNEFLKDDKMIYPGQDEIMADHVGQLIYGGGIFRGHASRTLFKKLMLIYLFELSKDTAEDAARDAKYAVGSKLEVRKSFEKFIGESEGKPIGTFSRIMRLREYVGKDRWNYLKGNSEEMLNFMMNIDFKTFFYLTGVDLKITGTNISYNSSRIFSMAFTPDFPVVEAVGISMNIPIAFSPIAVRGNVTNPTWYREVCRKSSNHSIEYKNYLYRYQGLYVDGGMLMNYPLHLFNTPDKPLYDFALFEYRQRTAAFSTKTLGFKLDLTNDAIVPFKTDDQIRNELEISTYLPKLLNTLMFYSETGQMRTRKEYEHSIELDTTGLETMDFAPSKANASAPILKAYQKTCYGISKKYFNESEIKQLINQLS